MVATGDRPAGPPRPESAAGDTAELEAILASLPDALVVYGPNGDIVRMNALAERTMQLAPGEAAQPLEARWGRYRVWSVEGRPLELEESPVARALRGEVVRGAHLRLEAPSGTSWVLASAAPLRAPDGAITGAVLTFSDETPMHALEEARDDLVRMISHDLRTPLSAVLAQAHLLRRHPDDAAKVIERATAITRSCDRMAAMIRDLLDATLLEAGQLRMAPRRVELPAFVSEAIERLRGALPVERVSVEAGGEVAIAADPERLERILVNLLSNALKYSPPQAPVVVVVAPAEGGATLTVADRGVGIAPEDLPHIFERFFRARGARRPEGLGLGLYITRLLVYAHGGRIEVESYLGTGTAIRVFLPTEGPLHGPPPAP
jgi:signal transduction histidine kinase